jgi:hypothetical protein
MTQPSWERKEAILELKQLSPLYKGPKGNTKDCQNRYPELDYIPNAGSEDVLGVKAVKATQIDEISESKIKVDVL